MTFFPGSDLELMLIVCECNLHFEAYLVQASEECDANGHTLSCASQLGPPICQHATYLKIGSVYHQALHGQ